MALFTEEQFGIRPRGSFNVGVRYEGDWIRFNDLIKSTDFLLATAAIAGQEKFANDYRNKVKRNIREGGKRFGYPRSEGEYLRRKQLAGASSLPLRFSDTMMDSVSVMSNSTKTRWMVGIPTGLRRPSYGKWDKNELEVHEYANIVEHGFSSAKAIVEARPVFSDTFKASPPDGMGGKNGLSTAIELAIVKKYASKGIRVTKKFR